MKPRVLLVDDSSERSALLEQALAQAGYDVVAIVRSGYTLLDSIRRCAPDVIIIDLESPDRDTIEHLCSIGRDAPRPVVMFTHDDDREKMRAAVRAGVSAYVVGTLDSERVKPIVDVAMLRFEEFQSLRTELEQARGSLAERKLVERAKGIYMRQKACTEEAAYRALRKLAMDRGKKVAEIAQVIVDADDMMGKI